MHELLAMRQRPFPPIAQEIRQLAVDLFVNHGLTQSSIAKRLGISQNAVSGIVRSAGVTVPVMFRNLGPQERIALIRDFNPEMSKP
jgi:predicted transcriptional regulator